MMKKTLVAIVVGAALAAVPATASASTTCHLYGMPITNIHTNVGCGTATTIAQVEYYDLTHWIAPHKGAPWHVTWHTVRTPRSVMSSLAFTARWRGYWATFEVGP